MTGPCGVRALLGLERRYAERKDVDASGADPAGDVLHARAGDARVEDVDGLERPDRDLGRDVLGGRRAVVGVHGVLLGRLWLVWVVAFVQVGCQDIDLAHHDRAEGVEHEARPVSAL